MFSSNKILLICDDKEASNNIKGQLTQEAAYEVLAIPSVQQGVNALGKNSFDVVIAKLDGFDLDAAEAVKELKKIDPDCVIIVFMQNHNPEALKDLFRLGIYDYFSIPVDREKLIFLVKKGIELHALIGANQKFTQGLKERNVALEKQNILLAQRIEESTKNLTRLYEDLRTTYMRTIKVLAQAIDARDHYTHSHSENVARYAVSISEEMHLSAKEIELIREACELHDLGKIGIQDNILSKPSSLTPQEWEEVRRHPSTGANILESLTFLDGVVDLVRQHHEHYDGSGYPVGLKGEAILLGARIIHLADAYEAMSSTRSYRKIPFTKEEAIAEIKRNTGTQFDPRIVEAFLKIVDKL